jgi:Septum formation
VPGTRERDHYARASLREQAADLLVTLRRNPAVVVIATIVLGGWFLLSVMTPPAIRVQHLATGDCLYIHAVDADTDSPTGRPAGTSTGAVTALYDAGAEKAPCDGSHSHEVVLQTVFPDAEGTAYPGASALVDRNRAACEAAFAAYVGLPSADSKLSLVVAVPTEPAWDKGVRAAPCLVGTADGQFLLAPAKGSGR